jgi:predicted CoA-binding protein
MKTGRIITEDNEIKDLLEKSKTIAVLGLSPNPERDSNKVAIYLQKMDYRIIPIRPGQDEILGEKAYASLDDIDDSIDIIDVFRNPAQILPHAQEALRVNPKVFWMQLGIENQEAAELLIANGIDVIMNRCIKIEHDRLFR